MTDTTSPSALDLERMEAFGEQLVSAFVGTATTAMVAIGHRAGLFDAASHGPATSEQLAARAGCSERHVREWLGSMATAGIVTYDPADNAYALPPEHAALLCGDTAMNQAIMAPMLLDLGRHIDTVTGAFRSGGGVPYEVYRPEFTSMMDEVGRRRYDASLVDVYLPIVDGLVERLEAGTTLVDLGCGTGHCINIMASHFPESSFVGFDFARDAVDLATAEAAALGLDNVRFEVRDVTDLGDVTAGVVTAFDSIHDQADPARVLGEAHRILDEDGIFFMVDINASSNLEDNIGNPLAPMIYAFSVLHCMEVSLALGGAGLGTAWGQELACQMLGDAGFTSVATHELPDDPFNLIYGCRR